MFTSTAEDVIHWLTYGRESKAGTKGDQKLGNDVVNVWYYTKARRWTPAHENRASTDQWTDSSVIYGPLKIKHVVFAL